MDVDALTAEKRTDYMKKGLCFNRDILARIVEKRRSHWVTPRPGSDRFKLHPDTTQKMSPKELYAHIRSITDQMDEKEKEAFYKEAEKEGF